MKLNRKQKRIKLKSKHKNIYTKKYSSKKSREEAVSLLGMVEKTKFLNNFKIKT